MNWHLSNIIEMYWFIDTIVQILDCISLQYARNANEQTLHTNDTKNARYTERMHDTRNERTIHETNARYTNEPIIGAYMLPYIIQWQTILVL